MKDVDWVGILVVIAFILFFSGEVVIAVISQVVEAIKHFAG